MVNSAERMEPLQRVRPLPRLRNPQQQTCKMCGQPEKFDFRVPDDVWRAVVPLPFQNYAICLYCFDEESAAKGIPFAADLKYVCFAGRAASVEFSVSR